MSETVRLRGHHLLCSLTYIGKGYTQDFTDHFNIIIERIKAGADILLGEGPDDICAAMHNKKGPICESGEHCLKEKAFERDRLALNAVNKALGKDIAAGSKFRLAARDYDRLRALFAAGEIREACAGCEWHGLCSEIAANGFEQTRLMPRGR